MDRPSLLVSAANSLLTGFVLLAWVRALRRARASGLSARAAGLITAGLALWLMAMTTLALNGWLRESEGAPPRAARMMAIATLGLIALALSPAGRRLASALPLAALVGFQVFRLPVELILWKLHREGHIPVQMTFEGSNFDVLTALSAPFVAWAARDGRARGLVLAWNVLGLALLLRITQIAVCSMPGPWRLYPEGPANTIVLESTFVWIPAVFVTTALVSHLLVFRALAARQAE